VIWIHGTKFSARICMSTTTKTEHVAQTQLDNRMAKAKPFKIGWTEEAAEEVSTSLNELLANYSIHYQRLRNFHWNVKGNDFFDLHAEFQKQYDDAQENIDKIAERIRVFDKIPLCTLQEYLDTAVLKETSPPMHAELMIRELLSDYHILLQYLFAAVQVTIKHSDGGTEQMLKHCIAGIEKNHWSFSSFMAK